jgi:sigma-54 dependent transcriptional regulator, acetoin dehydrogenase operon transcriptional activator AcoR
MSSYRFSPRTESSLTFGAIPQPNDPADISRSWQRCRMAGLTPEQNRLEAPFYTQAERRAAITENAALVSQARPVMEYVYSQIKNSSCIILLSDTKGYVLEAAGDLDFCGRAAKVALSPGACWAESQRGTNGIGTCLVEGRAVVVKGAEHYLRANNFLACTAAPLLAPNGTLLGVLDISLDSAFYHPHTFGLVRASGEMIEKRIFEISFAHHTKLRFHLSSDYIGGVMEGALAIDAQGRIIGANRAAFTMLSLTPADMGQRDAAACFDLKFADLLELNRSAQGRPVPVQLRHGAIIYLQIEDNSLPQLRRISPATLPPPAAEALSVLDTGDAQISAAIGQLRRVLGRQGVPILLQGESGTGKDVFARAIHAAGPRANGPFVTVNCAALPEARLEAELFGSAATPHMPRQENIVGRIREADGGTLFLDQIGEMPLTLQARLLRVLEEGHVTPHGGPPVPVDIAVICACQSDLAARAEARTFRADLYYRLNGLSVTLPPLRDRTDLTAIAERILARDCQRRDRIPHLSPELAGAFAQFSWPGNLRQLAGWLRTACLMLEESDDVVGLEHLSPEARRTLTTPAAPSPAGLNSTSLRAQSDAMIAGAVTQSGGNIAAAARHLGISRNTLYRRLAAMRGEADAMPARKTARF